MNSPISDFKDPRNYDYKGYICQCIVCENQYLGPKRSMICNLCANGKKSVDKESTDL